ncbi:hypothetical protein [Acinetobacter sp. WCHAc010052]|uniref:hypothetical protein n=1 Tax=Acinetobacter sp. WCHAc010052 TaxID=2004647 RepID=UPI000B3CACB3|nr:hypothetical protein [Acinetobacter sp. WCHAc010052]AXY60209.1 hypothetical protein CDG61_09330 [Acinetobacter sp. WCHAc010052]
MSEMDEFEKAFKVLSMVPLNTHVELWGEPKKERQFFEAGQESKQVEVDKLQKKLRDIESAMKKLSDAVEANECSDCCEHYFALEVALRGGSEVDLDS